MAGWDTERSSNLEIDENGRGATYTKDATANGSAVGVTEMKGEEEHAYVVTIENSRYNEGGGILIGLIAEERSGVWAWGYCPSDGHIYEVAGPGGKRKKVGKPLGRAGKAGTTVEVIVNMQEKTLSFSVNGAEPVETRVQLPQVVLRPWAQIIWEATLTLSASEGPDQRTSQGPKPAPGAMVVTGEDPTPAAPSAAEPSAVVAGSAAGPDSSADGPLKGKSKAGWQSADRDAEANAVAAGAAKAPAAKPAATKAPAANATAGAAKAAEEQAISLKPEEIEETIEALESAKKILSKQQGMQKI